jgi:hypothetical protein
MPRNALNTKMTVFLKPKELQRQFLLKLLEAKMLTYYWTLCMGTDGLTERRRKRKREEEEKKIQ